MPILNVAKIFFLLLQSASNTDAHHIPTDWAERDVVYDAHPPFVDLGASLQESQSSSDREFYRSYRDVSPPALFSLGSSDENREVNEESGERHFEKPIALKHTTKLKHREFKTSPKDHRVPANNHHIGDTLDHGGVMELEQISSKRHAVKRNLFTHSRKRDKSLSTQHTQSHEEENIFSF